MHDYHMKDVWLEESSVRWVFVSNLQPFGNNVFVHSFTFCIARDWNMTTIILLGICIHREHHSSAPASCEAKKQTSLCHSVVWFHLFAFLYSSFTWPCTQPSFSCLLWHAGRSIEVVLSPWTVVQSLATTRGHCNSSMIICSMTFFLPEFLPI